MWSRHAATLISTHDHTSARWRGLNNVHATGSMSGSIELLLARRGGQQPGQWSCAPKGDTTAITLPESRLCGCRTREVSSLTSCAASLSHALPSTPLHGGASRRRLGCHPAHAHSSHVVSEPAPFQTQLTVTVTHAHTPKLRVCAARRGRNLSVLLLVFARRMVVSPNAGQLLASGCLLHLAANESPTSDGMHKRSMPQLRPHLQLRQGRWPSWPSGACGRCGRLHPRGAGRRGHR